MTPATEIKRKDLLAFIERVLKPEPAVQAVIGIGSIATGLMRTDSDIDAVVFLDPLDWYIVPAEFLWRPADGTFHSIFTDDEHIQQKSIALDCQRLDWQQWSDPAFDWPEGRRAELQDGWLAFDRDDQATRLIARRTAFPESLRLARLDEAIVWLDQHLADDGPEKRWHEMGLAIAHDRLQAAFDYLIQALFSYNHHWLPWRNRRMDSLLRLPWLPANFAERVIIAGNAPGLSYDDYLTQVNELRALFQELCDRLIDDGLYSGAIIDQAFIRRSEEPGYAWNMDEWNAERLRRALGELTAGSREQYDHDG
jgi:hypothetical protein